MAQVPPQEVIDARYRAKLEARATGKAPVMVDVPKDAGGVDLDARAREKLSRHHRGQAQAAPAETTQEPAKDEPQPAQQSEERRDGGGGGQREQRHHKHR